MQRGSDRLSAHRDDEMKHELQGLLRSGHPTRTAEWHDPEPVADDDPEVAGGPVLPGRGPGRPEALRLELGRLLGRTSFPAAPAALAGTLRERSAPDGLVDRVAALPPDTTFGTASELARALIGDQESGDQE
ncbi:MULTISPECIES: DUF2795 domain-containing protein [unclassified Streptomyces]|uniref:DUF2795 domain-containing protein n=1 Tax=unclassified Streptomyces TaxID=2593676 RepID=UPI000DBA98B5|nr:MULTISPECIES: DUF2795 domain-containing protein [unclassified Streptomyces]MYT74315.1 DUF2795 domain-containing protein [Streptomyces sp. SID8367]RAJ91291.1 uncharacterized protein DUF2795 [Streptomyces sp. PsTaAH-137]